MRVAGPRAHRQAAPPLHRAGRFRQRRKGGSGSAERRERPGRESGSAGSTGGWGTAGAAGRGAAVLPGRGSGSCGASCTECPGARQAGPSYERALRGLPEKRRGARAAMWPRQRPGPSRGLSVLRARRRRGWGRGRGPGRGAGFVSFVS